MRQLDLACCGKLILDWRGPEAFSAEELSALPTGLAGVYLLAAHVRTRLHMVPFYVGQSASLRRRLFEHFVGRHSFARHLRAPPGWRTSRSPHCGR